MVDYDYFNNWSVAGGEKHPAYFACGTQWFIAHPSDRGTKPCLHWMTKGTLPCRFCVAHKEPCQIGYVPFFRAADYRPLFAIVYSEEREHVEKLRLHERVFVGRERDKGARIWVRRAIDQEPKFATTLLRRMRAADLTKSLLRLWKMPELSAWLAGASDNGLSLPPAPAAKSNGEEFGPMTAAAAKRYGSDGANTEQGASGVDEATRRMLARVSGSSTNGNGKHKPK